MGRTGAAVIGAVGLVGLVTAGCGSDASAPNATGAPGSTRADVVTVTTRPLHYSATVTGEREINGLYRQGVARVSGGWIFSTNNGLFRTDEALTTTAQAAPAIPDTLAAQTYNHIGDGDVSGTTLWVPVEKDDKDQGQQVMARYDAATLAFIDAFPVPQHHASFVTVDADGTLYSTDAFSDNALQRYRLAGSSLERLAPLVMSQKVESIQGGDVADGAVWLSTDDDHDGLYRVDMATGAVQDLGSVGHADGEGEGDDATALPSGLLHVVSADVKLLPMRLIDAKVEAVP